MANNQALNNCHLKNPRGNSENPLVAKKIKVLIFSVTYHPFIGGAEIAVKEITDRIDQAGFDLIAARLDRKLPKFEKIGRVNLWRVGQGWALDKYLFPLLAYFKARKLHQQKNYQIVQAIMAFYAGLAALFFKWTYPEVRYLLTMQSGDSDFFVWLRTWFWYPLYKKIYTQPDYIQAISNFLKQRARRYGYQGEIKVVANGVDLEMFQPKAENLKPRLGLGPKEKVVLTVSRLVKKNGVEYLIKAMSQVKAKLLIIGTGPEEQKLRKLVKELSLENKVLFLGQVDYQELPQYYSMADVFVRPSLSEGLGNVFLEAMASGVPVIGTPVGGIPDFLIDQETGLFTQPAQPENLAEKIKLILSNQELRQRLITKGQKMVKEKYDWEKIAQEMKAIYQKLS